ncbi:hypothetical protein ACFL17_04350 [Pseudomonadota bacterium]
MASTLDSTLSSARQFDGKTILFGNLHAHSNLLDDVRSSDQIFSPRKASEYARNHGLNFLAISDHHKTVDTSHRLALDSAEYRDDLLAIAKEYNRNNPGFIAISALEWGNTSTGNHINVIGPDELSPDSIKDKDYDEPFRWATTHAEFVQFNHPNSWKGKSNRNKNVGNFGEKLYASTGNFPSLSG